MGWPIVQTIHLSLTKWSGFGDKTFVGVDNYTRMLDDPVAQHALIVTLIFTAATTIVQTVLGMVIAVLVNQVWRKVGIVVRTILFIPGIVSFVVVRGALEADLRPQRRHLEPVARARSAWRACSTPGSPIGPRCCRRSSWWPSGVPSG